MSEEALSRDNAFWTFSVAVYAAPGVAEECLALQERYGVDVNLLLFCAWLGRARRIALTPADIETAAEAVTAWHESVVKPLRGVRRFLKGNPDGERLRGRVKAEELEAEKLEQAMLFAVAERHWPRIGAEDAAAANITLFVERHGAGGESAAVCRRLREAVAAMIV